MVDPIEWPVEHAEDVGMQHMLRLSAETGIPASTLAGLRDGSLVPVLAEMDDCAPLREAIDAAYADGEGSLTSSGLYALWRKLVSEYAAPEPPR